MNFALLIKLITLKILANPLIQLDPRYTIVEFKRKAEALPEYKSCKKKLGRLAHCKLKYSLMPEDNAG